jgi:hypothetical protein
MVETARMNNTGQLIHALAAANEGEDNARIMS